MERLQKEDIKKISQFLSEHGVRPSQKRIVLMHYLQTHYTHPTIDDMYNELHEYIPTLSKTTIYNTMDLFVSQGVVAGLNIDEKNQRFDADTSVHAHFMCSRCGKLLDVEMKKEIVELLQKSMPKNVQVQETALHYKGLCNECKNKK